jgi:hypothetical protein
MTSRYRAGQRAAAIISELQDQGMTTSEIALELQQRGVLMRGAAVDPVADLCDNVRDIVADFAAAIGQPADEVTALRARAESAERRLRITAALIIEAIGSVGPENAEDAARRLGDVAVERDEATARAEAAEQRAEALAAEVARLRAAGRVIACQWRAVDDLEELNYFALCWDLAHPDSAKLECDRGVPAGLALGNDPSLADLVAALRLMLAEAQPAEVTDG